MYPTHKYHSYHTEFVTSINTLIKSKHSLKFHSVAHKYPTVKSSVFQLFFAMYERNFKLRAICLIFDRDESTCLLEITSRQAMVPKG